ncbi:MAG TPA: septation protein A [Burkholderiaceae bacterium]|nr:septation protein A [Burkholderiaceae bacterium]
MKILVDLFPVIAFFGAFKFARAFPDATLAWVTGIVGALNATGLAPGDLLAVVFATLVAIIATIAQIAILAVRRSPIKPMVWVSAVLVVVFGSLTIWLQNEWFIKWKPTLLYWSFAAILLGGKLLRGRNLLGIILGDEITLPAPLWDRLLVAWSAFFVILGALNIGVAWLLPTESWVNFKTFGLFGLTLAFSLATAAVMARHMQQAPDS